MAVPPILDNKHTSTPSVFTPATLLREARRQKRLAPVDVPAVRLLDPDGNLVRQLRKAGAAKPFPDWPCCHTELDTFRLAGREVGIVGRVVGASFAVLVAEELFASGGKLLEGTSYDYAPSSEFADADPRLVKVAAAALAQTALHGVVGRAHEKLPQNRGK